MTNILFLPNTWTIEHPVYQLITKNMPDGWNMIEKVLGVMIKKPDLVMVPTCPSYDLKYPWILFIEDWVTLYSGHMSNGATAGIDVLNHPFTLKLREKFDLPNFKGIFCHHRGTFDDLIRLRLTDKMFYIPLGLPKREANKIGEKTKLTFTFINSFKAANYNFKNRGGEIMIRAFKKLWDEGERNMKLKLISGINSELEDYIYSCPDIEHYKKYISDEEMDFHLKDTDCLLLPSHRVHVNSTLMPFSYGIPVIGSDGWGTDEYIINGVNGYRVSGIYGKTSWKDDLFREDYSKWPQTLVAVDEMAEKMKKLIDDRMLLKRLGKNAHIYVNEIHSFDRMKRSLLDAVR